MNSKRNLYSLFLLCFLFAFIACKDDDPDDPDDPMVSDETIMLDCDALEGDRMLENGNASIDYLITCTSMQVEGNITVEPGTVIAFAENAHLHITSGSFNAVGTEQDPIIFRGEQTESGYWKGIGFTSNSSNNILDHVVIQDAGSNYIQCCGAPASLAVFDGKVNIQNITISNGAAYGMDIRDDAEITNYENVRITDHAEAPVIIDMLMIDALDNASDYTGNNNDYIEVRGNSIKDPVTFNNQSVPYYFIAGSAISIEAAVILNPGSHFLMAEETGLYTQQNGYLNAEGTSSQPITFEGFVSSTGYWDGIEIKSNNSNNVFDNVIIRHAGNSYVTCCQTPASISFKDGQATIRNTNLSDGEGHGLYIDGDFRLNEYENVTITSHADFPLVTSIEQLDKLDGMGSDYSGNTKNYILVEQSTMDDPVTIQDANVPYRIGDDIVIESNLIINEGTTFEFDAESSFNVGASGSLNALGSAGSKISFLPSAVGSAGFWKGIYIGSNNSMNRMENIEIRGAGSQYIRCCHDETAVRVDDGTLVIENATIADIPGCGISYNAASSVTITNVSYSNVTTEVCN